jgi:hypothetical protein
VGSRSKRAGFLAHGLLALSSLAISLALAEVGARLLGHRPFEPETPQITVEPGGHYQAADPRLGYRHLPGKFRITFGNGDSWTVTHGADTLRITRPEGAPDPVGRAIWIFGCSFIHGWGLDDSDTFAWKLQLALPSFDVRNFGVGGYSTLQSLLQFEDALERHPAPAIAVLAYAGFHDDRNTRTWSWREATFPYDEFGTTAQPYVRFGPSDELVYGFDSADYHDLRRLRHSALLYLLDNAYSRFAERNYRSHAVSQRLVAEFDRIAREHGVRFVIAGIWPDVGTLSMHLFARKKAIPFVEMTADPRLTKNKIRFDDHPSAIANDHYTSTFLGFLRSERLLDEELPAAKGE